MLGLVILRSILVTLRQGGIGAFSVVEEELVHSLLLKTLHDAEYFHNSLVDMYARNGALLQMHFLACLSVIEGVGARYLQETDTMGGQMRRFKMLKPVLNPDQVMLLSLLAAAN